MQIENYFFKNDKKMLEKIKDMLCRRTASSDRSEVNGSLLDQMSSNECDLKRVDGDAVDTRASLKNGKKDDKWVPNVSTNGITQRDINSVLLFPSDKRKTGVGANQIRKESKSSGNRSPSNDRTNKQAGGRFARCGIKFLGAT